MKRILGLLLTAIMLCACTSCTADEPLIAETSSPTETAAEAPTVSAERAAALTEMIDDYGFEGVIYAVENGSPLLSYASGTLENGDTITIDSPMPIGSVSKQFCAAAILLLRDEGKLSLSNTLDVYFPDYAEGQRITIHNLLSMRAGIPEMTLEGNEDLVTVDHTEEQNIAAILNWLYQQPLTFEPDERFAYTNLNYFMLCLIVQQVSGMKYIDFLRENFFDPLGMTHTGSIIELADDPDWAQGLTYRQVDLQPGLTNGCGDLISNAADMTVWIRALSGAKVISAESYRAMTADYSPEDGYGYGMFTDIAGGVGHYGAIGIYSSFDYINEEKDFSLFLCSNTIYPLAAQGLADDLLEILMD